MTCNTIPAEIRESGLLCTFRYEDRNGSMTKVPYNPVTGERARSNDPASFVPLSTALQAEGYDGLGVGMFNGICAIDLDDCVLADGSFTAEAAEIVERMHSYTELSPSGNGLHILFRAEGFPYDTERYFIMNRSRHMEVYVAGATNKYVTLTGNAVNDYPFGDRSAELQQVLDRYMRRPEGNKAAGTPAINAINAKNSPARLTDEEVIERASRCAIGEAFRALWAGEWNGHPSQSEADYELCRHLAYWTGRDAEQMDALFRQSGLMRPKWDEKRGNSTYGRVLIGKAIYSTTKVFGSSSPAEDFPALADAEFRPFVPLRADNADLPSFPVHCLPPVLRRYVEAVAVSTQTRPDAAAAMSLGILAGCVQRKLCLEVSPDHCEQLSLYIALFSPPGERKSKLFKHMTAPVCEFEKLYKAEQKPQIRANAHRREAMERNINHLKNKLEKNPTPALEAELEQLEATLDDFPVLHETRFYAEDCSSEKLVSLLQENDERLFVISPEGDIFDTIGGRYSGVPNLGVWLKGYDGDQILVDRIGRPSEHVDHPALSLVITAQPLSLQKIMKNKEMTGRGFVARFLYTVPVSTIGVRQTFPDPVPQEYKEEYRDLIYRLMRIPVPEEPAHIRFSGEALALYDAFFQKQEVFQVGEGLAIRDWAAKYVGRVIRIAAILHLAAGFTEADPLEPELLQAAIEIGEYFVAHAQYAYAAVCDSELPVKARFVASRLQAKNITQIKRSELFQSCRGKFFKKAEELEPVLALLSEHGYVRLEYPVYTGIGRPKDIMVIVNPEAA